MKPSMKKLQAAAIEAIATGPKTRDELGAALDLSGLPEDTHAQAIDYVVASLVASLTVDHRADGTFALRGGK